MTEPTTLLITGAAGGWGERVAARLRREPNLRLLAMDVVPAEQAPGGAEYVQMDLRHRGLSDLLRERGVEVVCHLAYRPATRANDGAYDYNVMGTIGLFGACARAGVRRIVARSSTMVYGAHPDNPSFLTEDAPLRAGREGGDARHLVELEQFYGQFHLTAPDISLAILRFANIVGPTAASPMARFLREPRAPALLGFDPSLQFIHEDDVVEALARAALDDVTGPLNVAADPPLPLTRALALAHKIPIAIPHPLAYWGASLLGDAERLAPLPWDYLRYRWVADTARQEAWGFTPSVSADDAVRSFAVAGEQPFTILWREAMVRREQWRERLEKLRPGGGEGGR